ncbi:hypothetical protein [Kitasatospora sp. NPDC059599]|uniref:hypothetical protein n=1 Tax=Kitasatospora sp. NPDC059599 TaxID=3346880 RepID=UPI0036863E62
MSSTIRTRSSRRSVVVAATLGVLALGTLALPAQAASADGSTTGTLNVQAPSAVGFAGQPVAFTETVTNTGTRATTYTLVLQTETGPGTPPHAITIDHKDPSNGTWTPVPLDFYSGADEATYNGMLNGITVAPGQTVTVDLRIGAPMGLPHDGASNGGFPSITLGSRLTTPDTWDNLAEQFRTIAVDPITTTLTHVPATAVAGGDPIEFDAVLANPTPSAYVNLGNVLFTDLHATVRIRTADGTWTTLPKVTGTDPADRPGVYLQGRDSTIAAGGTTTTHVRVSYDTTTPLGATTINPCLFVNEGATPFLGTTNCGQGATINITTPTSTTPTSTTKTTATTASTTPVTHTSVTGVEAATDVKPVADVKPAPATPVVPTPGAPAAAPASVSVSATTDSDSDAIPAVTAAVLAVLATGALLLGGRLRRRRS